MRKKVKTLVSPSTTNIVSPKGVHILIDFFGVPPQYTNNEDKCLEKIIESLIDEFRFTCKGKMIHYFEPYGVTVLYLLSESHISVHTWPEENFIAFDVYTCSRPQDSDYVSYGDKISKYVLMKMSGVTSFTKMVKVRGMLKNSVVTKKALLKKNKKKNSETW